jgi:hypothetical protein
MLAGGVMAGSRDNTVACATLLRVWKATTAVLLALVCSCAGDSKECSQVYCESQIAVLGIVHAPVPPLDVDICLNGACASQKNVDPKMTTYLAGEISAVVWPDKAGVKVVIRLPDWTTSSVPPKDGDVVTLRLANAADGAELMSITRIVTYKTVTPNGQGCSPACKQAEV